MLNPGKSFIFTSSDGGTEEKPVGLVYIGCYVNGVTIAEEHLFAGERAQVRALAVETALGLLERALQGVGEYTES